MMKKIILIPIMFLLIISFVFADGTGGLNRRFGNNFSVNAVDYITYCNFNQSDNTAILPCATGQSWTEDFGDLEVKDQQLISDSAGNELAFIIQDFSSSYTSEFTCDIITRREFGGDNPYALYGRNSIDGDAFWFATNDGTNNNFFFFDAGTTTRTEFVPAFDWRTATETTLMLRARFNTSQGSLNATIYNFTIDTSGIIVLKELSSLKELLSAKVGDISKLRFGVANAGINYTEIACYNGTIRPTKEMEIIYSTNLNDYIWADVGDAQINNSIIISPINNSDVTTQGWLDPYADEWSYGTYAGHTGNMSILSALEGESGYNWKLGSLANKTLSFDLLDDSADTSGAWQLELRDTADSNLGMAIIIVNGQSNYYYTIGGGNVDSGIARKDGGVEMIFTINQAGDNTSIFIDGIYQAEKNIANWGGFKTYGDTALSVALDNIYLWDGSPENRPLNVSQEAEDIINPIINSISINTTSPFLNDDIKISIDASDETELDTIFIASNSTGIFLNISSVDVSGTSIIWDYNYSVIEGTIQHQFTIIDANENSVQSDLVGFDINAYIWADMGDQQLNNSKIISPVNNSGVTSQGWNHDGNTEWTYCTFDGGIGNQSICSPYDEEEGESLELSGQDEYDFELGNITDVTFQCTLLFDTPFESYYTFELRPMGYDNFFPTGVELGIVQTTSPNYYYVINDSIDTDTGIEVTTGSVDFKFYTSPDGLSIELYINDTLVATQNKSQWWQESIGGIFINVVNMNVAIDNCFLYEGTPDEQPVTSPLLTYTTANTPPETPTILYPTADLRTNEQPLNLQVTFPADIDDDVITIYYYINDTLNQTSVNNVTFEASDGNYQLKVSLYDGEDFSSNTSVNFEIDTINPIITITSPTAIIYSADISVNVLCLDSNPFILNYTLYNSTGEIIKSIQNNTPVGQDLLILDTILIAGLPDAVYNFTAECSDTHTKKKIGDYIITYEGNGITYDTAEGNRIRIMQIGKPATPSSSKNIDRYNFDFGNSAEIEQRTYRVLSVWTEVIIIEDSEYDAHLVIPNGNNGNWIDFESSNAEIISVSRINPSQVEVVVSGTDFDFQSIGGLNVAQESLLFTIEIPVVEEEDAVMSAVLLLGAIGITISVIILILIMSYKDIRGKK